MVDDGSTDETPQILEAFGTAVRGVRLPHNRGRSAARNAGVAAAAASLVIFVDSDVVVRDDFLRWHLRTHADCGPGVLSRGPVVLIRDPAQVQHRRVPRVAASPAYLDTANAGIERAALLRAGGFDEGFPGYGWEDFELGLRLQRQGVRRVFCREAVAFHVVPDGQRDDLDALLRKEDARARSAVYFYRKVPSWDVRLLIQFTPVHRALYWLQSAGGLLTPQTLPQVSRRLRRAGLPGLEFLALRGVLNRHYMRALVAGLTRDHA